MQSNPDKTQESSSTSSRFKFKTHEFDRRGRLVSVDPYRMFIREGARLLERPLGSGNLWHESGAPAGRVEIELMPDGTERKTFQPKAEHKAFVPPQQSEASDTQANEQLSALEQELAAIRAERDALLAQAKAKAPSPVSEAVVAPESQAPAAPQPIKNYGELL
jgi:hypothetical protein